MARKARIKSEFGIFHIQQSGGGVRPLFTSKEDRKKFIDLLNGSRKRFNFLLHGYCITEDDQYDIILDVNGGDLSKIMKSINIAYAMYVKAEGKLFHDRFKSHLIEDQEALIELKNRLNDMKLSCNFEQGSSECYDDFSQEELKALNLDDCDNCIQCYDTARMKLEAIADDKGVSLDELLEDKSIRNQLIMDFRKASTLSLKNIGELFGGLSESSVSKIIKTSED